MLTSFLSRKPAVTAIVFALAAMLAPAINFAGLAGSGSGRIINTAQAAQLSMSGARSIDVMKYTKDVMANQPSDAEIDNLASTLKTLNVDYIALSIPMDATSDYPAGSRPAPRTAEAFTQKWADAIHNAGLHVLWRGTFSGIEGIYNFPKLTGSSRFPTGTAASAASDGNSTWLGKTYQYIAKNPSFFQSGDIWAPLPERTEGIFSDSTSFIASSGAGLQANYTNFFNDLKTISERAFAQTGKTGILTGLSANNYTEVMSTWLPQSFFDTAGHITIDYYGNNHTPAEIDSDLRKMYAMRGKPVFLQEWGDYWNQNMSQTDRTAYLNQVYAVLQKLTDEGILAGFNYWGGWDNGAEGILTKDASGFHLNYRGQLLAKFFAANAPIPAAPVSNPLPTNNPSQTVLCPQPAANAFTQAPSDDAYGFTGCYFSGQNFNNPVLSRTDALINFEWGSNSPDIKIPADQFSAKWTGNFNFSAGDYTFTMTSDDGSRLYIDNLPVIDQWSDHAATVKTATRTMSAGVHNIRMEYYEAYGGAVAKLNWTQNQAAPTPAPIPAPAAGFTGNYYSGLNFNNLLLTRTDSAINFVWNEGRPDAKVPTDLFSVRWTGDFNFTSGSHTFTMTSDDGSRLYIDGVKVIDAWSDHASKTYTVTKKLSAGKHNIKMEYYEAYGGAVAKLNWN